MIQRSATRGQRSAVFSHEVTFYEGIDHLPHAVVPFVREGVERREQVLVAMVPDRWAVVEDALGADAAAVDYMDMSELGGNPARIIPEWRRFVEDATPGSRARGVGEPAWPGRRDVELDEAAFHESLLNLAFDDGPAWRLLCPYDSSGLDAHVLTEARHNHPVVHAPAFSDAYRGAHHASETFAVALPAPPADSTRVEFGGHDLVGVRSLVQEMCRLAGVQGDAEDDLVLAAHELATNSVLHAGGGGYLTMWRAPGALVVEISDGGRIDDPLVGRNLLDLQSEHGRGIWMANQLCHLVQVRSGAAGTQVRLYSWTSPAADATGSTEGPLAESF